MPGKLVVVTGTGTSIGKTHFAEALLLAWGRSARVIGVKPVESGVANWAETDSARLIKASSFHVKLSGYELRAPLSPHLAAREQGIEISLENVVERVEKARQQAEGVLLELPGGLFTPLADRAFNAHVVAALRPDSVVLVAPDRLGVLHDVTAATRAAAALSLRVDGVVLMAPDQPDASTGRNAAELTRACDILVLATLPRASPEQLSRLPALERLIPAPTITGQQ